MLVIDSLSPASGMLVQPPNTNSDAVALTDTQLSISCHMGAVHASVYLQGPALLPHVHLEIPSSR